MELRSNCRHARFFGQHILRSNFLPEQYPQCVGDEKREADVEREALGRAVSPNGDELGDVGDDASDDHGHFRAKGDDLDHDGQEFVHDRGGRAAVQDVGVVDVTLHGPAVRQLEERSVDGQDGTLGGGGRVGEERRQVGDHGGHGCQIQLEAGEEKTSLETH